MRKWHFLLKNVVLFFFFFSSCNTCYNIFESLLRQIRTLGAASSQKEKTFFFFSFCFPWEKKHVWIWNPRQDPCAPKPPAFCSLGFFDCFPFPFPFPPPFSGRVWGAGRLRLPPAPRGSLRGGGAGPGRQGPLRLHGAAAAGQAPARPALITWVWFCVCVSEAAALSPQKYLKLSHPCFWDEWNYCLLFPASLNSPGAVLQSAQLLIPGGLLCYRWLWRQSGWIARWCFITS